MTDAVTLVFGRGGHALEVVHAACETGVLSGRSIFTVVADDCADGRNLLPYETLTESTAAGQFGSHRVFAIVAIGSSFARRRVVQQIQGLFTHVTFPNVIAPSAIVTPQAIIEPDSGLVLLQNAMVSNLARIGQHSHINIGAVVAHECVIGDFATIAPHAVLCGRSSLDPNVVVGANSTVNDGVHVGADVIIGANSVVLEDIDGPGTFVGSPVRRIQPSE